MACQQSLARLRALVDPALPEVQMASSQGFKHMSMQAMGLVSPANGGAFVTGGAVEDGLVNAGELSILVDSPAPSPRACPSPRYADRLEETEDQWRGLSGAMEIKILSAAMLGLTQKSSALSLVGGPPEVTYSKPPLPCPKVTAYVAAQAPPQRIEARTTPDLPERSANPIWNSTYFFTVEYAKEDKEPSDIRFEVWNVDGRNEFLGEVTVPFPREDCLMQYHVNLKPNPVKMPDATKEINGCLSVQISFKTGDMILEKTIPRMPRLQVMHPSQLKTVCGTLCVEVVRALGLRSADLLTSDPYCVVLAACAPRQMVTWKTSTKMKTLNPVWRELHEFQMNWPNEELDSAPLIKIEIWDWDDGIGGADDFLGEVSFALPHGDGENLVDLEVQPNRSKSPNTVKGRIQARVYFKNQFHHDDKEGVLDPYEKAFCEYFGSRVVDEQFARTIAPPLVFFHFGWQRILFGQCRDAWRRASHELLASKAARGHKTRAQCYIELVSSFTFAVAFACVVLAFTKGPSELIAIIAGCCAAIFVPSLANVLANFVWHREEPLALVGRMGLGGRGWGVPLGWALFAFFASLAVVAGFLAMAEENAVKNLWLSVATILIGRLVAQPLIRGIRMTWLLSVVKTSKRRDWFIRLFPSIMTAHGALLQRLPSRLLAPSF